MKNNLDLKKIISHCKEYGFVFPSSEIYDGLGAVYDYGPLGVAMKNNIRAYWWKAMVGLHDNIVGLDASIFMHPKTWKASGHVDAFNDPLIDNKDSKKRYRADVLIEDYVEKLNQKILKEIDKARKKIGDDFDESLFKQTNPRVLEYQSQIKTIIERMVKALDNDKLDDLKNLITELGITDPVSGSKNWTNIRQFNLMFGTKLGSTVDNNINLYLRPETAQGIFVNFLNVQKSSRMKIPFGIAQTGKAFRNEIVARQFIFRMREFEQMEMQFFIKPRTQNDWYEHWKTERYKWHLSLGMGSDYYRFHDHDKPAHYADAACDIEFNFPFGFKELEGIHSRTNFDLKSHEIHSGKKLKYFDSEIKESYTPYVLETSIGLDRMFLAVLSGSYCEEAVDEKSQRVVLKIPPILSPIKVAVLPLLKKDGLNDIAKKIASKLKWNFEIQYDEKDAIGKRYRRQDAIGTPFCITIDHQTQKDETITIRYRDTMEQKRIGINDLERTLSNELQLSNWLKNI